MTLVKQAHRHEQTNTVKFVDERRTMRTVWTNDLNASAVVEMQLKSCTVADRS